MLDPPGSQALETQQSESRGLLFLEGEALAGPGSEVPLQGGEQSPVKERVWQAESPVGAKTHCGVRTKSRELIKAILTTYNLPGTIVRAFNILNALSDSK